MSQFVSNLRHKQTTAASVALLPELHPSPTFALLRLGVKGVLSYGQAQRELPRAAAELGGEAWMPRETPDRLSSGRSCPSFTAARRSIPGMQGRHHEHNISICCWKISANKEISR